MRKFKFLTLVLLFAWPAADVAAQEGLNRADYEELRGEYDYSDDVAEPMPERENREKPGNPASRLDLFRSLKGWILTAVIMAALVLLFFLWRRYRHHFDGKQVKPLEAATSVEHAERELLDVSLDNLLKEALASGDIRTAFRLHYLELLRTLHRRGMINWEPYKTNGQYVAEFARRNTSPGFRDLTAVFDRTWYGHKPVDERAYHEWLALMERIKTNRDE